MNIQVIQDTVREHEAYFIKRAAQARLLALPGVDYRVGIQNENLNLINPTGAYTAGKKALPAAATSISSEFTANHIRPQIFEKVKLINFLDLMQKWPGNNDENPYLTSPTWIGDYLGNEADQAMSAIDTQGVARLNRYVGGGSTGDSGGASQFTGTRLGGTNIVAFASATAANQLATIAAFQASVAAVDKITRFQGTAKTALMGEDDAFHLQASLLAQDQRNFVPNDDSGALTFGYRYADWDVQVLPGLAAGERHFFDANNLTVKSAAGIVDGYREDEDDYYIRSRFFIDANFKMYDEVVTTIPATS